MYNIPYNLVITKGDICRITLKYRDERYYTIHDISETENVIIVIYTKPNDTFILYRINLEDVVDITKETKIMSNHAGFIRKCKQEKITLCINNYTLMSIGKGYVLSIDDHIELCRITNLDLIDNTVTLDNVYANTTTIESIYDLKLIK